MIAGTPLAFANVMPEGNIGVIGASGTGIQELCSQIALADEGITHAIGGGRDLSAEVGGISALTALEMPRADDKVRCWFCVKTTGRSCSSAYCYCDESYGKTCCSAVLGYTSAGCQRRERLVCSNAG